MQSLRKWWVIALLAAAGAGACLALILSFILRIVHNELPWGEGDGVRQIYQLVGQFYGQGFFAGFFLCFCLIIAAIAINTWVEESRAARREVLMATAAE